MNAVRIHLLMQVRDVNLTGHRFKGNETEVTTLPQAPSYSRLCVTSVVINQINSPRFNIPHSASLSALHVIASACSSGNGDFIVFT